MSLFLNLSSVCFPLLSISDFLHLISSHSTRLIEDSKMKIFAFDGLDEAAAKVSYDPVAL